MIVAFDKKPVLLLSSVVGLWLNRGLPGFPVVLALTPPTSGLRCVDAVLRVVLVIT